MSLDEKADNFIQSRLDALYAIDSNIVTLLDNLSLVFDTYHTSPTSIKSQFPNKVESIYDTLSKIAIDLRKEVRIMDDNIGVYDKNDDGVMILPISVDQKNTQLGRKRLNQEVKELDKLLESTPKREEGENGVEHEQKDKVEETPVVVMPTTAAGSNEDIEMIDVQQPPQEETVPVAPEQGQDQIGDDNVIDKLKSREDDDDNDDDLFEEV